MVKTVIQCSNSAINLEFKLLWELYPIYLSEMKFITSYVHVTQPGLIQYH